MLMIFVVYAYHFIMVIIGMDKYVHYTRFIACGEITDEKDFQAATDVYDSALFITLIFHIIEWVR